MQKNHSRLSVKDGILALSAWYFMGMGCIFHEKRGYHKMKQKLRQWIKCAPPIHMLKPYF